MRQAVVVIVCLTMAAGATAGEPVAVVGAEIKKLQAIAAKIAIDPAEPVGKPAEPVGKPVVDRAEPVGLRELQSATPQLIAAVGALQRVYQKAESKKGLPLAGAMSVATTDLQKEIAAYGSAKDPASARRSVASIQSILVTIEKLRKEIEPCCNVFSAATKETAEETCAKQAAATKSKSCEAREGGRVAAQALFTCVCN